MSVIGAIAGPFAVRSGLITSEPRLAGWLARLERDEK